MLGACNVNGAPCELLVEQDALTWWPTAATTGGRGGPPVAAAAAASPLKHLRRLSNASSVILNNISQLGGNDDDHNDDNTSDIQQQDRRTSDRTKNKRRIEFGQIVGLRPIVRPSRDKKSTGGRTGNRADQQQSDSGESKTPNSDESSHASQREQPQPPTESSCNQKPPVPPPPPPPSGVSFSKFKIYYVKRSEKKASGRLLKLKKISIAPPSSKLKNRDTLDRENSNSSSSTHSIGGGSSASGRRQEALAGLYEQIEQYLELVRRQRPKRLLVFVNPFGGKGRALHLYKSKVRKVLELAQVECELVVTEYANHARETIEDPQYDLSQLDGIICIGGDGMFAELMNGLLFRCNRDKLLACELSSLNKHLSGSLSCSDSQTDDQNDAQQPAGAPRDHHRDHLRQQHLNQHQRANEHHHDTSHSLSSSTASSGGGDTSHSSSTMDSGDSGPAAATGGAPVSEQQRQQIKFLRSSLGGIGEQFATPSIPIGVIGAGSTDANLFGFIGTNDAVSATLNIVLGQQILIDVCSIHSIQDDRLLRFVSTFVAYGYFGDVIRESEKFRWLGPSRYDLTALNSLIKYRHYEGLVRVLRSSRDGSPLDSSRCHLNCRLCGQQQQQQQQGHRTTGGERTSNSNNNNSPVKEIMPSSFSLDELALARLTGACDETSGNKAGGGQELTALLDDCNQFEIVEAEGPFVGVNAAVTACRCPQTRKGFSPGNHLANGCADLILVRPCSRVQYINYLIRTGYTKKSAFDLKYVDAYRCRQFEFVARRGRPSGDRQVRHESEADLGADKSGSSWNADGEILREQSLRVKVNNRLLRVFGTGEPQRRAHKQRANK